MSICKRKGWVEFLELSDFHIGGQTHPTPIMGESMKQMKEIMGKTIAVVDFTLAYDIHTVLTNYRTVQSYIHHRVICSMYSR